MALIEEIYRKNGKIHLHCAMSTGRCYAVKDICYIFTGPCIADKEHCYNNRALIRTYARNFATCKYFLTKQS